MAKFILIETSTALCSTALAIDGEIVSVKESSTPKAHAAMTAPFVKQMLDEAGISCSDCDAVCVSAGPGSYTGLRVGSSTAKGLCFGAGIPLIAVGTLDILASQAITDNLLPPSCTAIIPMIDARRMEVYTAVYSAKAERISEVESRIIDSDSFDDIMKKGNVLFIGDGAGKCSDVISGKNATFVQVNPNARAMLPVAEKAFKRKDFSDTAYFEPFYLKDFVAVVSKKNILREV